jgi:hypothetical protein
METAPTTDAARQWEGYGTALKPSFEPVCLARKPLSESTVAQNVLRWGTGALNIDGCRIPTSDKLGGGNEKAETAAKFTNEGWRYPWMDNPAALEAFSARSRNSVQKAESLGRWPANLIHDDSPEVLAGFPESASGIHSRRAENANSSSYGFPAEQTARFGGDSGSAARFFASFPQEENQCQSLSDHASYAESCFILSSEAAVSALSHAVAASTQRLVLQQQSYQAQDTSVSAQLFDEIETLLTATILNIEKRFLRGLQPEKHFLSNSHANVAATPKPTGTTTITINLLTSNGLAEVATFDLIEMSSEAGESAFAKRFHYTSKANADDRLNSNHPTVKPVDLMQWLVRLVCPKGATVLDPFAGTGTTGAAAFIEGRRCVLIEREAEYLADIEKRMGMLLMGFEERSWKLAKSEPLEALPLFALTGD